MAVIKTTIETEAKVRWRQLAASQGQSESELLRTVVLRLLATNPVSENDFSEPEARAGKAAKRRMEIRWRTNEHEAIEEAARRFLMKPSDWLVSLVRANLYREPRPTDTEMVALRRSNDELLAIGRNLNQVAYAMHRGVRYKDSVTVKLLDQVREQVREHVDHVGTILDIAENRWKHEG